MNRMHSYRREPFDYDKYLELTEKKGIKVKLEDKEGHEVSIGDLCMVIPESVMMVEYHGSIHDVFEVNGDTYRISLNDCLGYFIGDTWVTGVKPYTVRDDIDDDCVELCTLLHSLDGINVMTARSGDLTNTYRVWFYCEDDHTFRKLHDAVYEDCTEWAIRTYTLKVPFMYIESREVPADRDHMKDAVRKLLAAIRSRFRNNKPAQCDDAITEDALAALGWEENEHVWSYYWSRDGEGYRLELVKDPAQEGHWKLTVYETGATRWLRKKILAFTVPHRTSQIMELMDVVSKK
jgi:hypothetical protein